MTNLKSKLHNMPAEKEEEAAKFVADGVATAMNDLGSGTDEYARFSKGVADAMESLKEAAGESVSLYFGAVSMLLGATLANASSEEEASDIIGMAVSALAVSYRDSLVENGIAGYIKPQAPDTTTH